MPCELVGLADVDEKKKRLAKKYGVQFKRDFRDLLPLVDALAVATPASTHFQIASDCLLTGKHLLVEKPLALNLSHAHELVKLAGQRNLTLAVGHLYRMNPAVIRLKEELKEAGHIRYAKFRYINLEPQAPPDCDIIFDLGVHLFDLILFLIERTPKKLCCFGSVHPTPKKEGCTIIHLDFGDFTTEFELSWLNPQKKRDGWFIMPTNSIYIDMLEQTIRKYAQGPDWREKASNNGWDIRINKKEPLKEELKHFLDCVENRSRPINNAETACQAVHLCEIALKSSSTGSEVYV